MRSRYPCIKVCSNNARLTYELELEVDTYPSRQLRIVFKSEDHWSVVSVYADGPSTSPHRYRDNSLCMWYPKDPPELQWSPEQGLVGLIEMARRHLFREAFWRDTDEWLGPEVGHAEEPAKAVASEEAGKASE